MSHEDALEALEKRIQHENEQRKAMFIADGFIGEEIEEKKDEQEQPQEQQQQVFFQLSPAQKKGLMDVFNRNPSAINLTLLWSEARR